MLINRKIIVLHTIKHSESALVVQCYCNQDGKQSFYLKGKSLHNKFHRLAILDVIIYKKNISTMGLIKEISSNENLLDIRTSVYKSSIAIFMSEIVSKCFRETESDTQLFNFLCTSISLLEHTKLGVANFHIHFITNICKYLGFMPNNNYNPTTASIFCVETASFISKFDKTFNSISFTEDESLLLNELLNNKTSDIAELKCNGETRNKYAKKMISYISYHLGINIEIKSLDVLHEVFI